MLSTPEAVSGFPPVPFLKGAAPKAVSAAAYSASGYQGKGPIQRSVMSLRVFISSHSS